MITREEELKRLGQHISSPVLLKHMIAVSAIMRGLADRLGEDAILWEAVGMLHDVDYERVGEDWGRHGLVSAELVADILPDEALHAIRAHNEKTGAKAENKMDIALIASDALSGLVIATALMMPDKKLVSVKVSSLSKKFKDNSFARGVNREKLARCSELSIGLEEFLDIGLASMKSVSVELGL